MFLEYSQLSAIFCEFSCQINHSNSQKSLKIMRKVYSSPRTHHKNFKLRWCGMRPHAPPAACGGGGHWHLFDPCRRQGSFWPFSGQSPSSQAMHVCPRGCPASEPPMHGRSLTEGGRRVDFYVKHGVASRNRRVPDL